MKLDTFLSQHDVSFVRLVHPNVFTAQDLAAREHVPGMKVAKPVVVRFEDGSYALCVVPAACRVDLRRVAELAGHDSAALAGEGEMRDLFPDCEIGAEPPFGSIYGLPTWMDASLRYDDYLVFQSGRHSEAFKVARTDYERLAEPLVAQFAFHV